MIYLDSAATSLLKPACVRHAVSDALLNLSSPGRGGYESAMKAADTVLDGRMALAELFHVKDPERVVFTSGGTEGLNIAIKSLVAPGDRVVVSGYEHNAVIRPLNHVGARVDAAVSPLFDREAAIQAFREKIPGAACVVCTHVSNVFGFILPVEEISEMCRRENVPFVLDASQSAGTVDIDLSKLTCAFAAMPGHKGLLGPQGTGVLLCGNADTKTIKEGGTGSDSLLPDMPEYLPDRLEAGTHNVPGIAGLAAGAQWLLQRTPAAVLSHERQMLRLFCEGLSGISGVRLIRSKIPELQTGVISFVPEGRDCEAFAEALGRRGVAVRAGYHCAPHAHRTAGTEHTGTVRVSFSPFTTEMQVSEAVRIIRELIYFGKQL